MHKLLWVLLACVLSWPVMAQAATGSAAVDTWYVRPTGACTFNGDGLSYTCAASDGAAGAFSTFANVIYTATTGVDDGDTLYVCGAHLTQLAPAQSGSATLNIIANGACPNDAGSIDTQAIVSDITDGVHIEDLSNWTVKNLSVKGRRHGIFVFSTGSPQSGFVITGNTIDQRLAGTTTNACHGIYFAGGGGYSFTNVLIDSNTVVGTKVTCGGSFNDAMSIEKGITNITITSNNLTSSHSGVDMSGAATGSYLIARNTIRNIRGVGIRIEGSLGCPSGMTVTGNVVEAPNEWGVSWIDISNSTFSNNTIRVYHDAVLGPQPFGAITVSAPVCAVTGNTFRNNILEAHYGGGVVEVQTGTRADFESQNTWDHNRLNQSGSEVTLIGWFADGANNMYESNQATWAITHVGDTYGDVTYVGPVCSSEVTCLSVTSNLRLPSGSSLRRSGSSGSYCIDVRGRACYPDRPDIGAYQATSGDPANTRTPRTP